MKLTAPGKEHLEKHYEDLKNKKFFPGLITYMTSGPVVAMVWEGKNAVKEGRKVCSYPISLVDALFYFATQMLHFCL